MSEQRANPEPDAGFGHSQVPWRGSTSLMGRLTSLASKRDPLLRAEHQTVFVTWLPLTLRQQAQDLDEYLQTAEVDLHRRLSVRDYADLVPDCAGEPERRLFCCDLEAVLALLRNQFERRDEADWRVDRLLDCVAEGDVRLTLKDFGVRARASEDHLGATFRRRTGVGFRRYLCSVRMRRAAELLRDPRRTAREIAGLLGYSDSSNFIREFRKALATTPARLRVRLARMMESA